MAKFLSRLRRRKQSPSPPLPPLQPPPPTLTPPVYVPPLEQKIHPDLDALAAEYTAQPRKSRRPSISLSPRGRRDSEPGETLDSATPPPPPGPSAPPPSAWFTFGVGRKRSVPHITDFGESVLASTSQQSPTSTTRSSPTEMQTPNNNEFSSISPPSSGFTFGGRNASDSSPPPPLPPLDHPAFVDEQSISRFTRTSPSINHTSSRPRVQEIFGSASVPTMSNTSPGRRNRLRRKSSTSNHAETNTGHDSSREYNDHILGSPFSFRAGGDDSNNLSDFTSTTQDSIQSVIMSHKHRRSPSLLSPPPPTFSFTKATPDASPIEPPITPPPPASHGKGKRKAEEVDGNTPPDVRKERQQQRATFAPVDPVPRPHRQSATSGTSSYAPSSYTRKRARLSAAGGNSTTAAHITAIGEDPPPTPTPTPTPDTNTGSIASRARRQSPSVSQVSIPISALVSPHAPSVSYRSSAYHMRDPRKPPRIQPTAWSLDRGEEGGSASPMHAWLFFLGFVCFPLWWVAGFLIGIPRTRRLESGGGGGGGDAEKGVVLDDPQVEHDARSWRFRCRIMAGVSLLTYVPFIVCVAVFVPR